MRNLPVLALVALSTLLAAIILLEVGGGRRHEALLPGKAMTPRPLTPSLLAGDSGRDPGHVAVSSEQLARLILARPLFSPSRRPGHVAVGSTELPRLAGIIIGPAGARAIFASAGGSRAVVAGPGGRAGPYLIRAVDAAGVAVLGPAGPQILRPVYDGSARSGAPEAGTAQPSGMSILDLLRARVQNGNGIRPGLMPIMPQLHPPP